MDSPKASKEIFSFVYLKNKTRKLNSKSLMAVFSKYTNVVLTPFLTGGLQLHVGISATYTFSVYINLRILDVDDTAGR